MSDFEHFIWGTNCHFKYAKGAPAVEGEEFHSYNELVFFMEGESRLISKHIQLDLEKGAVVIIPREQFHQFVITNPENYVRCIVGFENMEDFSLIIDEVVDEVMVISNPPFALRRVFDSLIRAVLSDLSDGEKQLFLRSCVYQSVLELKLFSGEHIHRNVLLSSVTQQAMAYIDKNFSNDISVDSIAAALNTSLSSLSHKFKADLNISVYRYISEKRISVARQLVAQGESLTRAALLCGFKEYSSFFKLYKKRYSRKPSEGMLEV